MKAKEAFVLLSEMERAELLELCRILHEGRGKRNRVDVLGTMTRGEYSIISKAEDVALAAKEILSPSGRVNVESKALLDSLVPAMLTAKAIERKASKDSLLLVEFVEKRRRTGMTIEEAIREARKQKQWKKSELSSLKKRYERTRNKAKTA